MEANKKKQYSKILFSKELFLKVLSHTSTEIKGFFGEYRFLSNFWPAKVVLDDEEYSTVENAYQAAKFKKECRKKFQTCTPKESIVIAGDETEGKFPEKYWTRIKVQVMRHLLVQKFSPTLNPDNHKLLMSTGDKYLEETNYWEDIFWGVHKTCREDEGVGENNLGQLLMEIRSLLRV